MAVAPPIETIGKNQRAFEGPTTDDDCEQREFHTRLTWILSTVTGKAATAEPLLPIINNNNNNNNDVS